ncbi:putative FBD-associated F-box protein [Cardamine amara subsp. amara]|uniref:FBD-associated F-box protein n=1 Tax=Cardamine amara subsp. amara TaxID=228776 RepID=A0ABD0ZKL5_CARAN
METQRLVELPDELLLKILSLLPMYKDTVATRLISKRWEDPWKLEPDVMFDDETYESFETFMSFVYGSLLSNDAQILERLHLKLISQYNSASDINFWVQIAVNRFVRELRFDLFGETLELPSCLSTCRTLKTLILHELSITVVPPWFRLPSLKTLHLLYVKFSGKEYVSSLLKVCPVLECLVIDKTKDDNVIILISDIIVPTLRSLSIRSDRELRLFGKTLQLCRTLEELNPYLLLLGVGLVFHHSKRCTLYRLSSPTTNLFQVF